MRSRLTVLLLVSIGLAAASGCKLLKKKAGGKCSGDEAVCLDDKTILECHDDVFLEMACKGPQGCTEKLKGTSHAGRTVIHNYAVECDFTGNAPGDACLDDDALCAADKGSIVECKDNKVITTACLGPKGCRETATTIDCDTSVQNVGAPCEGTNVACAPDKKQILRCEASAYVVGQNCRGPKGCSVVGQKIDCDDGKQSAGDPCMNDDDHTCAADGKAVLKCSANVWSVEEKCKKTCVTRGRQVGCQ
jgi:hypothetical protein